MKTRNVIAIGLIAALSVLVVVAREKRAKARAVAACDAGSIEATLAEQWRMECLTIGGWPKFFVDPNTLEVNGRCVRGF